MPPSAFRAARPSGCLRVQHPAQLPESVGCLRGKHIELLSFFGWKQRQAETVQRRIRLEKHPDVGLCLCRCLDFFIADVVDTGSDILNQPGGWCAWPDKSWHCDRWCRSVRGKEYLCTASFRVMSDVGKILAVEIRQTWKECPVHGILLFDKGRQVCHTMNTVINRFSKGSSISGKNVLSVSLTDGPVIQWGKERSDCFSRTMQLFVFKMRWDLFFYPQYILISACLRQHHPWKFHADGIMYLFTLFSYSGMKPAKRITFEMQEYGIPQCLPLLEVSGQFF